MKKKMVQVCKSASRVEKRRMNTKKKKERERGREMKEERKRATVPPAF